MWLYDYLIRPIIGTAAWFLGSGYTRSETQSLLEAPPHLVPTDDATVAIAEAERARYFAQFIRDRPGGGSFGQLWFAAARGAWYAGYGEAPTPEQRTWAYTRPQDMLGLRVRVVGVGLWSGEEKSRSITVNAPWSADWQQVEDAVRQLYESGSITLLVDSSEPMEIVSINLVGGALLKRQEPTFTM